MGGRALVGSSKQKRKSERADPMGQLGCDVGRATMVFHNTVAQRLGLNPADHRCLEMLHRAQDATAGDLAEWTGLTTGAITGMVDRLEQAGFVRREAHRTDRRKVVIRPVPERVAEVGRFFEPLAKGMATLCAGYSEAELKVIMDYLTRLADLFHCETQRLRREETNPIR